VKDARLGGEIGLQMHTLILTCALLSMGMMAALPSMAQIRIPFLHEMNDPDANWTLVLKANESAVPDGDQVVFIDSDSLLYAARDTFEVLLADSLHFNDCMYKTPSFKLYLLKDGSIQKTFGHCFIEQVGWHGLDSYLKKAIRIRHIFKTQTEFEEKSKFLAGQKQNIILRSFYVQDKGQWVVDCLRVDEW
jgi:hypothetical protein